MSTTDQLLKEFVQTRSQSAFDQLTRRHAGLVHASILRRTRDRALSDDATQAVFLVLALKAPTLLDRPLLASWLLKTARFAAIDAHRKNVCRVHHERCAASQRPEASPATPEEDPRLAALDQALLSLTTPDREAIMLRFYQDEPFANIAIALGTTQEAARKLVSRALVKLRRLLEKRGCTLTAIALLSLLATSAKSAAAFAPHISTAGASITASRRFTLSRQILRAITHAKFKLLTAVSAATAGVAASLLALASLGRTAAVPRLVHEPAAHVARTAPERVITDHASSQSRDRSREFLIALVSMPSPPCADPDDPPSTENQYALVLGMCHTPKTTPLPKVPAPVSNLQLSLAPPPATVDQFALDPSLPSFTIALRLVYAPPLVPTDAAPVPSPASLCGGAILLTVAPPSPSIEAAALADLTPPPILRTASVPIKILAIITIPTFRPF